MTWISNFPPLKSNTYYDLMKVIIVSDEYQWRVTKNSWSAINNNMRPSQKGKMPCESSLMYCNNILLQNLPPQLI